MDDRTGPDPVRGIGAGDVDGVVDTLTLAFADDPVMSWVFPDPRHRRRRLAALWRHAAWGVYLPAGACTALADDHTPFAGAALWRADDAAENSYFEDHAEELAADLGEDLGQLGVLGALMAEHHPDEPHWYLLALGTRPELQGRGIGGTLLARTLAELDAVGAPAYLEATSTRSRVLYERHGFEITAVIELPDGPSVWPMWRPPAAT